MMRLLAITLVMFGARIAAAESAVELQAEGEAAAKAGNYAGAIDKFKAADRLESRASHACLIALAYTRRNLWPQAEIFRSMCHARATTTDPLPDWMGAADKAIDNAIAAADVAVVTIRVEPAEAAQTAQLTVSSFAPDESFAPRAIHLPPGVHQVFASARGYEPGSQLVEVKSKTAISIVITLHRSIPEVPPSRVPWIVMGAGLATAATGAVLEGTWYRNELIQYRNHVNDPGGVPKSINDAWELRRDVVIGCYVAGGLAVATGLVLKYTVFESAPSVAFVPRADGGIVALAWLTP
jgi:hypothetical protein